MSLENKSRTIKRFHSIHDVLNDWLQELESAPDLATAKRRLHSFQNEIEIEVDYHGPHAKRIGHKQYDDLIEKLFTATNHAIPKEALLELFLNELYQLEHKTSALCAFTLEVMRNEKGQYCFYGGQQRGLVSQRWNNFCDTLLPKFKNSAFFRHILVEHQSMELWHVRYIEDYNGELDGLVSAKDKENTHQTIRQSFWLNAVPLLSNNSSYPDRALFILYPDKGREDSPNLPMGANQEWRSLHFLSIAYQQLEHRLRNVAAEVYKQRQSLLNNLAPGILHHEIGHQTRAINDNLELQHHIASRLLERYDDHDVKRLAYCIQLLEKESKRLYEITNAFNALERRRMGESFCLSTTLKSLALICKNRLEKNAIALRYDKQQATVQLTSDSALLLQLLSNIVINAANAFNEWARNYKTPPENYYIQIRTQLANDNKRLLIYIENNGPPIPERIRNKVFEKGFTSYKNGHGQGLYICQLIAQYLGGTLELATKEQMLPDIHVGFILNIPLQMPVYQDLESNRK